MRVLSGLFRSQRWILIAVVSLGMVLSSHPAAAQAPALSGSGDSDSLDRQTLPVEPRRFALIVIGLAGDAEHESKFLKTSRVWREWLVNRAGVQAGDVKVLVGHQAGEGTQPATADSIGAAVEQLSAEASAEDAVWLFLIGHGSQDQQGGWFHLPGADLSSSQWADLFVPLPAKQQVFWLTHAASGGMVEALSRPGRIVIAATDGQGEVNETRFPHALAAVMDAQASPAEADNQEADKQTAAPRPTTVLSLFLATCNRVGQSFIDETLLPTEHPQLDDNGDRKGSEAEALVTTASDASPLDGALADQTMIDWAFGDETTDRQN